MPRESTPKLAPISDEEPSRVKYEVQEAFLRSFLEQINLQVPSRPNQETEEIDVVISGGGMKGYFVVGAWSVLQHLVKEKRFSIRRWAGTSVGACSAIYMCCGIDPVQWSNCYWKTRRMVKGKGMSIMESFEYISNQILPENAHELCSGRVFLSITVLTLTGPKNMIVSEFKSREDLMEACIASCNIPYMTSRRTGRTFRGMRVLDGGFTNNTPIFPSSDRRQLVFHTPRVEYPSRLVLALEDPCIDSLVIRGAFIMRQFIAEEYVPSPEKALISWRQTKLPLSHSNPQISWQDRLQSGLKSASTASLLHLSGFPASKEVQYDSDIEKEWTIKLVQRQMKMTLAHYRMAIIIVIFSIVLMAAPLKWENAAYWARILKRLPFFRRWFIRA